MNYSYLSQFKTPFENSSVKRKKKNSGITARISAIPVQVLTNTDFCSQGILMFKDQYRAVMQYSLPRDGRPGEPPRILHDWICSSVSTYYSFCLFFVETLQIIDNRFPKVHFLQFVLKSPQKPTKFQTDFWPMELRQKSVKNLVGFLVDLKTPKIHSEIN